MNRLLGPGFAHHVDQTGVGHDQRVRFQGNDWRHVFKVSRQLGVMRKDVADHKKLLAPGMRFVDALLQRGDGAKRVIAHAQAVTRLAGVDRIGAKIEGGAHHQKGAGRGEEFGSFGHSRMPQNRAL